MSDESDSKNDEVFPIRIRRRRGRRRGQVIGVLNMYGGEGPSTSNFDVANDDAFEALGLETTYEAYLAMRSQNVETPSKQSLPLEVSDVPSRQGWRNRR